MTGDSVLQDLQTCLILQGVLFLQTIPNLRHSMLSDSSVMKRTPITPDTVLYELDETGAITFRGLTRKQFVDYMADEPYQPGGAQKEKKSKKEACKDVMLSILNDGEAVLIKELTAKLTEAGFSEKLIESARAELVKEGLLIRGRSAGGSGSIWTIKLAEKPALVELSIE